MKTAYLINQYPLVSHTFIRREIRALEQLGVKVHRISIRSTIDKIIDEDDRKEFAKTSILLDIHPFILISLVMRVFLSNPLLFLKVVKKTFYLGAKSKAGVLKHFIYLIEACALKIILKKSNTRHLHAHFGTNPAMVALLCRAIGGPPFSFTVHGPEEFDNPNGLLLKEKIRDAKFVIAVSNYCRSQLMRHCHVREWSKIHVVHCTVDNAFIDNVPVPLPDKPRLICVGRLCEQKGQLLLVEALNELKKQAINFEMIFAGDGDMRNQIELKINELKLNDSVKITGWLTGDEVKREIIESRALVLPSFAEGLPVVIMEAFALGRPVISTCIAGIPELVENNINGYLVPPGSIEKLTETLTRVLTDDLARLQEMGDHGFKKIKNNHNSLTEAEKIKVLISDNL
ncbi:MAG: glycosyltransferase family 4 protein [Deltaproteobacteria bacterium]|nr:glycosyltransferase family 4 protein [Deltaproteobacteria bacterium]